jgi:hypothetical protein
MPETHYPDIVAETDRARVRRLESELMRERAEAATLRAKLRFTENELFHARNRLARFEGGARA